MSRVLPIGERFASDHDFKGNSKIVDHSNVFYRFCKRVPNTKMIHSIIFNSASTESKPEGLRTVSPNPHHQGKVCSLKILRLDEMQRCREVTRLDNPRLLRKSASPNRSRGEFPKEDSFVSAMGVLPGRGRIVDKQRNQPSKHTTEVHRNEPSVINSGQRFCRTPRVVSRVLDPTTLQDTSPGSKCQRFQNGSQPASLIGVFNPSPAASVTKHQLHTPWHTQP